MITKLKTAVKGHYAELYTTIKLLDIEERFDIHFSRFWGLFFAKLGLRLRTTPTGISIASLITGIAGGGLLYFQNDVRIILAACVLLTFAGILDSADGQLARMSNQSTELGRIIDGLIDNFVFLACYVAGAACYLDIYGWYIVVLALLAGGAHSLKSAIYDFYKSEYMYFGGPFASARTPYPEEIRREAKLDSFFQKVVFYLYFDYTRKQFWLSTRTRQERAWLERVIYSSKDSSAVAKYRKLNKPIMTWWAIFCGTNTHRSLIMFFSLLGRFDMYLFTCVIGFVPMLFVNQVQKRRDKRLLQETGYPRFAV